jgi:F-type H+-transporting ATPase subunit gamma
MVYLPAAELRTALQHQARRLVLRAALHASLAQENRWRLSQMERAQDHLDELGRSLQRLSARRRQTEITNELETLMSAVGGAGLAGPA